MGCWHETCGITNLPIRHGQRTMMMLIRRKRTKSVLDPFDAFEPISSLEAGVYNDYGWMEWDDGAFDRLLWSLQAYEAVSAREAVLVDVVRRPRDLPADTFQWFCREDAFGRLLDMPVADHGYKVSTLVDDHRKALADAIAGRDHDDALDAYAWLTLLRRISADGVLSRIADSEHHDAIFPLIQLRYGLSALRKSLAPPTGSGSQDWNFDAYSVLVGYYIEALDKEHALYDE